MSDTVAVGEKLAPVLPTIPGYELLELIGRGGMGRVYRARDRQLGRSVAIKMLTIGADQPLVDRFLAEAKAIAQLDHPRIAQLFEFGSVDGQPFYVMEYASGGSLAEQIADHPLEARLAAEVVAALATAIDYAHQQGIVHRDLKPANILLTGRATEPTSNARTLGLGETTVPSQRIDVSALRIADFGLAKHLAEESKLTQTGDILGTPSYMAPEQASGTRHEIGPATDIYALGAILYELLTGRPPFVGPDSMQTVLMVLSDEPVPPRQLQRKLPLDLQTICLKCLEKKPQRRYATAGELAADLQRFLLAQPILARPVSWWERAWKWMVRNPWQATALGGLAVSLGGAILGVISLQSANQRTHIANLNLQQANRDLLKAKSESDVSFALTQESLARIVDRLRDDLYNVPQAEAVMLSTARDAAVLHRKLHRIRPEDRSVQRQLYQALRTLWLMEANHGNTDHSQQALQELQLVTNQMHARAPDDVGITAQRIGLTADQADLLVAQGKPAEATKLREQVAVEVEQLERKYPTDPDALKLAAEEAGRRFNLAAAAGDLPGAIAATQARVEFTRRQLQNAPASATDSAKLALAQYLCGLGDILAVTRDTSAARKAFEQAEEIRGRLSQSLTEPRSMSAIDARVNKGLALVALLEQDLPLARAKLDVAEQQLRRSLEDYPEDRRYYHKSLADILLDHARLDVILEQPTAARSRVEQASKLVTEVLEGAPGDQLALGLNERVKQTEKAIAALAKPTSEAK